ncbi:TrgA family protein [Tropicimonas sp. S265A]|uniref:TrgA family protein n=1 Tax=Tropicimonas sp. S265A TaxID=3415134 RepID=UPI003C7C2B69
MPTGAKLLGAILFALTGALAAWIGIPGLPDGRQAGLLIPIATLSGAYFGWTLAGAHDTSTLRKSLVLSFRTMVLMFISTMFFIAGEEAYQRSIKLRYDGPVEAVTDIANLMIFFGEMAVQPAVLTVMGLGVIVGAVFVSWAGRVWE